VFGRGGQGTAGSGKVSSVRARRSWNDKLRYVGFGSGVACSGGHGEVGHGQFRHGEVSRVKAVLVWHVGVRKSRFRYGMFRRSRCGATGLDMARSGKLRRSINS